MRKLGSVLLIAGFFFCGGMLAELRASPPASRVRSSRDRAAAQQVREEQSAAMADRQLSAALASRNRGAAARWLAPDFFWVDPAGKQWTRHEVLDDFAKFQTLDVNPQAHDYSPVMYVTGTHEIEGIRARFVRVWVKRGAGWRVLAAQDTPIVQARTTAEPTVPVGTPCVNPCKMVPDMPRDPQQRSVVEAWQATERAVDSGNADEWAAHVADEFVFNVRENGKPLTKAERVAMIRDHSKSKSTADPGEVQPGSIRVWVLGDSAVMVDTQRRASGGNPYRAIRVWVRRDARWQMAFSQQTFELPAPVS